MTLSFGQRWRFIHHATCCSEHSSLAAAFWYEYPFCRIHCWNRSKNLFCFGFMLRDFKLFFPLVNCYLSSIANGLLLSFGYSDPFEPSSSKRANICCIDSFCEDWIESNVCPVFWGLGGATTTDHSVRTDTPTITTTNIHF